MLEEDNYRFWDTSNLINTENIDQRANPVYIKEKLEELFPDELFLSVNVVHNISGKYKARASWIERVFGAGKAIEGLPEYYEVEVIHSTGEFEEHLIVWSPVAWNDRFSGTAGGGTGIGGRGYLTKPKDTQRGWTVPYAVMNGFSAATIYAGNIDGWDDHTIDKKTGKLNRELYENWRVRSTHNMTIFGKAITEILHQRPIKFSYMNGGSGGGRQSLMEVQNYPGDYDGVWASCPAINWNRFLLAGFWPVVVMNEYNHFLTANKNQYFLDKVYELNGGKEAYYKLEYIPEFDPMCCIGEETPDGVITEMDALVMKEILDGPVAENGERFWYGFIPGVKNWQKVIPIGTYYYPLFGKKVKPFLLGPIYAKWITENPKSDFSKMKKKEYFDLYRNSIAKFSDNDGNNVSIEKFVEAGSKLIIDHGIDDPLIPVDGTLDYYNKLKKHFGIEKLDSFFRLYITPGDNHGNCWGNGPGITESAGLKALIDWREKGISPEEIRKVKVNKKTGELIEEGPQRPYRK